MTTAMAFQRTHRAFRSVSTAVLASFFLAADCGEKSAAAAASQEHRRLGNEVINGRSGRIRTEQAVLRGEQVKRTGLRDAADTPLCSTRGLVNDVASTACGYRASSASCVKASQHLFSHLRGLTGSFVPSFPLRIIRRGP